MNTKTYNRKSVAKRIGDVNSDAIVSELTHDNRIVGLTNGMFSLISLIHSILKKVGKSSVTISTWSAGWYDMKVMEQLIDSGLTTSIRFIIDRSAVLRKTGYSSLITEIFKPENIRTSSTHSKFVLIENEEWKICILSSMNLNENKKCENFDINTDCEIFNLFNDFASDLFEKQQPGLLSSCQITNHTLNILFDNELNNDFDESDWSSKSAW